MEPALKAGPSGGEHEPTVLSILDDVGLALMTHPVNSLSPGLSPGLQKCQGPT